jgi:predicted nucleic acid-binding protein
VRLEIADTGPVNYLILIGHIDLLHRMFERVVLPAAVQTELSNPLAPPAVQRWIADCPAWLEIAQTPAVTLLTGIHKGEAAAIALAAAMHADLLLISRPRVPTYGCAHCFNALDLSFRRREDEGNRV